MMSRYRLVALWAAGGVAAALALTLASGAASSAPNLGTSIDLDEVSQVQGGAGPAGVSASPSPTASPTATPTVTPKPLVTPVPKATPAPKKRPVVVAPARPPVKVPARPAPAPAPDDDDDDDDDDDEDDDDGDDD
jgi:outer membrane biosynthesis protein TonB